MPHISAVFKLKLDYKNIFIPVSSTKLHGNLSNESRTDTLRTDRLTNMKQFGVSATVQTRIKISCDSREVRHTKLQLCVNQWVKQGSIFCYLALEVLKDVLIVCNFFHTASMEQISCR